MKNTTITVFKSLASSFTTEPGGASARKLSAFVAVVIAIVVTFKYCNADVLVNTLTVWLVFALFCMGLVTIADVITLKNGKTDNQQ